jgi:hypothetical protein
MKACYLPPFKTRRLIAIVIVDQLTHVTSPDVLLIEF